MTRKFDEFTAVDDLNQKAKRGTIDALIGLNDAGKSTCFNVLTRFLSPSAGRIIYDDRDITTMKSSAVARLGLVRSLQISAIFPHLTLWKTSA